MKVPALLLGASIAAVGVMAVAHAKSKKAPPEKSSSDVLAVGAWHEEGGSIAYIMCVNTVGGTPKCTPKRSYDMAEVCEEIASIVEGDPGIAITIAGDAVGGLHDCLSSAGILHTVR